MICIPKAWPYVFYKMILDQIDCLRVQHDQSLQLLRCQWCGGAQLHSFAQAMLYMANLVRVHGVTRVLIDVNGLPDLSMKEQLWVGAEWLPQVEAQSVQQVAFVLPLTHTYNQMVVESILEVDCRLLQFDVQFFAETSTALDWLTASSTAHMLALAAEWEASCKGTPTLLPAMRK